MSILALLTSISTVMVNGGSGVPEDPPPLARLEQVVSLVIPHARGVGRTILRTDPVQARLVAGTFHVPSPGDSFPMPDGSTTVWQPVALSPDGSIDHPGGPDTYVHARVESPIDQVVLVEAKGHIELFHEGEPRAGDPYSNGYVRLPVRLRAGVQNLLIRGGRGRIQLHLMRPKSDISLDLGDATLPDLLRGESGPVWAAIVVTNATGDVLEALGLEVRREGSEPLISQLPSIPGLSLRKVPFLVPSALATDPDEVGLTFVLRRNDHPEPMDHATASFRVRNPDESHRRTFRSGIDGSVQFYGVRPARLIPGTSIAPAIVLTLHGAGVDALGQVDAYASKSWAHLVAPTNRRPFGFDWEDWGRLDALEVLTDAQARLRHDPRRIFLTGHSMGGHGSWHLATTYPDRFAAVGPSAGWISFSTYAGGRSGEPASPLRELLGRSGGSDPMALAENLSGLGVYMLHGDADDNVPVAQARSMAERLATFHRDFRTHEQAGAGHWWDASDEPGTDCVDWAPLFDFFARRVRPELEAVRGVEFSTTNPAVSSRAHWAEILVQSRPLHLSSLKLKLDPMQRRFSGTTSNITHLALDLASVTPGTPVHVKLDDQDTISLPVPADATRVWVERTVDGKWKPAGPPQLDRKNPVRGGPFKNVFNNDVMLVYGTTGTPEETAWARARARFDGEVFWYRGNGSLDIVPDTAFDPAAQPDRNLVLYGHAGMNSAWPDLLQSSPVRVERGSVRVDDRVLTGDDLAALFLRPRPGSKKALVGVVAGTGLPGMRLTHAISYFTSGLGVPDLLVVGSELLERGEAGVRVAGMFGNEWDVASGEFLWNEPNPREQ